MQKHNGTAAKHNIEDLLFTLRDKIEESGLAIDKRQALAITVLLVLVIGGSLVLYVTSRPKPVVVSKASDDPAKIRSESKAPAGKAEIKLLYVHVAGAVAHPGVYHLKDGERVIDAISVAGGALSHADQDALNLAAKLSDGQRIYVPKEGESLPGRDEFSGITGSGEGTGIKVNINTATMDQLDSLPGVGEVTARRILEYRNKHGSFKRIDELRKVEGIGSKKFEHLRDLVTVD